jgi:hypothetical protein
LINLTNITQKKWAKACIRLGLEVDKKKGKGSHYRIINPVNHRKQTLPSDCHKFISLEIYKTLLEWNINEEDIDKALSK